MTIKPYSGGSRTDIRLPHEIAPVPAAVGPDPESPPDPAPQQQEPDQAVTGSARQGRGLPGGQLGTKDAGGVLLGLVVWAWIVLPFLQGGKDKVGQVLKAKFLNKGPGGEWLP